MKKGYEKQAPEGAVVVVVLLFAALTCLVGAAFIAFWFIF